MRSGGGPADAPPAMSAETLFSTQVEPMLATRCGGCHTTGRIGPDFLRPEPDVRTMLLSFPALIDLDAPASSRLLTKGEHDGPAFRPAEAEVVRRWIEREAEEGTEPGAPAPRELATVPVAVGEGFNALSLEPLGLPGASLFFVAERVGGGILLDDVRVAAGPAGARLSHPVFVSWVSGAPRPDPIDRFAGLELEVEPNRSVRFDSGTVVLTDFPAGSLLSVHFDAVGPLSGGATPGADGGVPMPGASGCAQLTAFRDLVTPALTRSCTRCHGGGNASATGALDMSRVAAAGDADLRLGCNQILGRISPMAPSSSGLFVQPDPAAGTTHPFTFGTTAELNNFRRDVLAWFEMETP
jgi:cytochrome c553